MYIMHSIDVAFPTTMRGQKVPKWNVGFAVVMTCKFVCKDFYVCQYFEA